NAGQVTLTNGNLYSGATVVNTTATLVLNGFGSILNTSGVTTIGVGATLQLDNQGGTNNISLANRIGDATNVTLNGGTFLFTGNNAANVVTSETIGPLTLGSGQSTITSNIGSGTGSMNVLTIGTLVRSLGATANFTGNSLPGGAFNQIKFI